jgi:hypothetical protein
MTLRKTNGNEILMTRQTSRIRLCELNVTAVLYLISKSCFQVKYLFVEGLWYVERRTTVGRDVGLWAKR